MTPVRGHPEIMPGFRWHDIETDEVTIRAAIGEERETLEDVVEPYLIQEGLILRTPRGRTSTRRAHEHLVLHPPRQGTLL